MGITKNKAKKVNPFELKFNKSKHDVLGKKKLAHVGAPTMSRKRAFEQREQTLGVEFDRKNKISKIIDKRIGEREGKTEEEKNALRFTEERVKNYKRASKFNLTDDVEEEEILTHGGHALSDIEKYDKSMIDDSDDDDSPGNLGSHMVKVAHFGGGEKSTEEKVRDKLTREDFITSLISKSKIARQEKQAAKDEQEMITESLDEKFRSLLGRVQDTFKPVGRQKIQKDDYDKLALALKIESDNRATPAERKMTEEEVAATEKEKLEELEAARLARMNTSSNAKPSHLSADADVDLDAGSKADARKEKRNKNRFEVRFDDGKMRDLDKVEKSSIRKTGDDEEELTDEEIEDEEEDLDDMMNDDEEEEDEEEDVDDEEDKDDEEESKTNDKKVKKVAEKNGNTTEDSSIPFVFELPKNYKKFCALLEKYPHDKIGVVLERLIKCHHPSLKEGNKTRLNKLTLMVLRLFDDMAKEQLTKEVIDELNVAQATLYSLTKFDVQYMVRCVRALIRQHWKLRIDKQKNVPVNFSLIALLRLVTGLFPVSDNWHPVCTPSFFLATTSLSHARIATLTCLARQMLLAQTLVEYVADSKRYVPELMSFVKSALLLAVAEKPEDFTANGFPISKPLCEMLCVDKPFKGKLELISLPEVFDEDYKKKPMNVAKTDSLRVSVLRALISLVQSLRVMYSSQNETFTIVFGPILRILRLIKQDHLPAQLKEELDALITSTDAECKMKQRITQMSLVKTEKSMLRMLEPRFEYDFDPERPKAALTKGKAGEKKRMQKDLKNEMRGAIKELRKDTQFLARKQLANVKSKDRARNAATRRLMGGLQQQQGEWNKEKRTNDVENRKARK